jgi:hypothetical protein
MRELEQPNTLQDGLLNNTIIYEGIKLWESNHLKLTYFSDGGVQINIAGYGIIPVLQGLQLENIQLMFDNSNL